MSFVHGPPAPFKEFNGTDLGLTGITLTETGTTTGNVIPVAGYKNYQAHFVLATDTVGATGQFNIDIATIAADGTELMKVTVFDTRMASNANKTVAVGFGTSRAVTASNGAVTNFPEVFRPASHLRIDWRQLVANSFGSGTGRAILLAGD